jgi:hypothetical protein
MVVQQIQDIFGIVLTNLFAWFNILDTGTNGVSAERRKSRGRKSRRRKSGDDSIDME